MREPAFFGRTDELAALREACAGRPSRIVVLCGRRRTGKTALIQKFCGGRRVFFYTAGAWKDAFQLAQFSRAAGRFCGSPGVAFPSWQAALSAAASRPSPGRRVIVIDEFQNILRERPGFLTELQALWEVSLSRQNLLLILCADAASFAALSLPDGKNPPLGRDAALLTVRPLPFRDLAGFAPSCPAGYLFRGYAALGGMPRRWEGLDPGRPMTENLAAALLRANGFLHDEAQTILREEFREPGTYGAILRSIALGASARGEIARESRVDPRTLTKYLSALEEKGLIDKEAPVFAGPEEQLRPSGEHYRMVDPLVKFWYRFSAGAPSLIMSRQEALAEWGASVEPFFAEFASDAFEEVCRQYLCRRHREGSLPFRPAVLGRWRRSGTEIDIAGADQEQRRCLAGECGCGSRKAGLKELRALQARCSLLPAAEDARFDCWIFSRAGFEDALQEAAAKDPSVHLVGMEELLR
ncbi:MAG: ATP-binding protein [Mesosutterella sp.]|nr:ATP-binding protein [Mesosutterella sp.]